MDVADDPVGVVREGVDGLDREQRPLKGRHAVEGHAGGEELDDGIRAQPAPGAAEGEQAVEHAAPRRRPEHEREGHAEQLKPVGQRRVEQVVRAGPDIKENQRPEMDHRQPVGIDRPLRRLRQKIIHDAQNRRGKEEGYGVVPVPPLDEAVLHAAEDRVTVRERGRDRQVVDDVEHRHGDDRRDVEPEGDVEGLLVAPGERPEEVHREHDPDDGDGDVDGPDELGVFLAAGETEWERDGRGHDDELPAPEVERGEEIAREARLHKPLRRVVDAGEHHVADKGEDDGVGVERAESAETQPGLAEVGLPEVELGRDEHADEHADGAPDDGCEHELPHDPVGEFYGGFLSGRHGRAWRKLRNRRGPVHRAGSGSRRRECGRRGGSRKRRRRRGRGQIRWWSAAL